VFEGFLESFFDHCYLRLESGIFKLKLVSVGLGTSGAESKNSGELMLSEQFLGSLIGN
jgi:hypothetical protein